MVIRFFGIVTFLLGIINYQCMGKDKIPVPDILVEYQIAELNKKTPVSLDYNDEVREFISLFTGERREAMSTVIGLSELYFPLVEEILDSYGLPFEIKFIAIVESALNPFAVSTSGAVGFWQFLPHTARMFDLEVSSYIDERRDVLRSTEAAARYMKYLYEMFGDWHLVFAAYNSGPGVVRNAIIRSGGKTGYWEIRKYLPEQSRRFIPAFIAINYLMHHYSEFDIIPVEPEFTFSEIDTIQISRSLDFKQISSELGIPVSTLRFLNPVYKLDHIPAAAHPNVLVLPVSYIASFLNNRERIFAYREINKEDDNVVTGDENDSFLVMITHTVSEGEFIHKIALRYGTIANKIIEWNNLSGDVIHEGQKLTIWVSPEAISP